MNAISSIKTALPREPFEAARDAVAAWRGQCLDVFARSEAAVTETLLVLAAADERGLSLNLPHLVGQRFDAISNAIGAGGAFEEEGKSAVEPLANFRKHDVLRAQIAHGVFGVTLDHRGQWHLAARVLALRAGRENRELLVAEESEAWAIFETLKKDGQRLGTALGQLRHHFCKS